MPQKHHELKIHTHFNKTTTRQNSKIQNATQTITDAISKVKMVSYIDRHSGTKCNQSKNSIKLV